MGKGQNVIDRERGEIKMEFVRKGVATKPKSYEKGYY